MEWTKEQVIARLNEIEHKGFISVPARMYRNDDGIVGQILEREFEVDENNLHIADLGTYELKGMRIKKRKSSTLTLFHQTSTAGMTPIQIFDRFSYVRASQRDGSPKRKLFTTIYGNKENSLGFILKASGISNVDLYYHDEYLARWDLSSGLAKIQQVLLAFAETTGKRNSSEEQFHYIRALINITDAWIDGKRVPLHINIINAMRNAGYEFRNTIIWDRRNLVNRIGIFGWPSSYITMGTTFEYILDFTIPAPPKKPRSKSKATKKE